MLSLKRGLCTICADDREKPLIAGVCQAHYWESLRAESIKPVKSRGPYRDPSRQNSENIALDAWYADIVAFHQGSPLCWNCGQLVSVWNYKFAKAAVAHILPKKTFSSVEVHKLNYLFLGADCGCHNRWDRSWSSASEMKIFPVALERFLVFAPEIALAERKGLPDIFLSLMG